MLYIYLPTVEFNEQGLSYKDLFRKCNMDWKDVAAIGLIDYGGKWVVLPWIYFSATSTPMNRIQRNMFSNQFIAIQYTQEIYDVVQSYWKEPIEKVYTKNPGTSSSC